MIGFNTGMCSRPHLSSEGISKLGYSGKNGAQNDFSGCTTWLRIDKKFYLMDLVRGRFEYPRLKETALGWLKIQAEYDFDRRRFHRQSSCTRAPPSGNLCCSIHPC